MTHWGNHFNIWTANELSSDELVIPTRGGDWYDGGILLIYGTLDMPNFGSFDSPAQMHLGAKYLQITYKDMGIPNVVTAILASYRGYDTLGETVVVLTAGLGVILLLSGLKNRDKKRKGSASIPRSQ